MNQKSKQTIVIIITLIITSLACSIIGSPIQASPITQVVQVTQIVQVTPVPPITQVVIVTKVVPNNPVPSEYQYKVYANQGWQNTEIYVDKGHEIIITVLSGRWTQQKGSSPYNSGEGGGYICTNVTSFSQCVEPLPDFPQGGLVGRIGNQDFWIGNGNSVTALQTGTLQLRINDGDDGLYDNDGMLLIQVVIQ